MFPQNIGISSKAKDTIVALRKIQADLFVIVVTLVVVVVLMMHGIGGPDKGQFSRRTKTHSDRNVLFGGSVWIKGR
jgi:hypothetical protein